MSEYHQQLGQAQAHAYLNNIKDVIAQYFLHTTDTACFTRATLLHQWGPPFFIQCTTRTAFPF